MWIRCSRWVRAAGQEAALSIFGLVRQKASRETSNDQPDVLAGRVLLATLGPGYIPLVTGPGF